MPKIILNNVDVEFAIDAAVRNTLKSSAANFFQRRRTEPKIIKALHSISLTINNGERIGIIGPNGAGKTTLLKVMSRIYAPKSGFTGIEGRICPLFEFVTGFEMDANGWDNIKTRALLLGMSAKDIDRQIDKIAEFTGLGEFLNIPVRCYSSGMLLRLAFATSTAVEPEILLLDEVMAAGDAAFIDQAGKRMDHLIQQASIVVFATHNLQLLPKLCERTLWLDRGRIVLDGNSEEVSRAYLESVNSVTKEHVFP